jgi:hypothetical protein
MAGSSWLACSVRGPPATASTKARTGARRPAAARIVSRMQAAAAPSSVAGRPDPLAGARSREEGASIGEPGCCDPASRARRRPSAILETRASMVEALRKRRANVG